MTTRLEGPLRRELDIRGRPHTLVIDPLGLHLVPKGHRKGYDLQWQDLVSGEAALAVALHASLHGAGAPADPAARAGAGRPSSRRKRPAQAAKRLR